MNITTEHIKAIFPFKKTNEEKTKENKKKNNLIKN